MSNLATSTMLLGLCSLLSVIAPVQAAPLSNILARAVRVRRRRRFPVGAIVGIVIGIIILLILALIVVLILRKVKGRKQKKLAGAPVNTNYPTQQTSGFPINNQPGYNQQPYNGQQGGYAPPPAGGAAQEYYK